MTRTCRKAESTPAVSRAPRTLPPDLLAAGVRRLGYVALLTASVSIVFSVVLRVVAARAGQPPYAGIVLFGEVAGVVASLGIFALTRRAGLDPVEVLDRDLVFEVAMGLLFALTYHSVPVATGVLPKGWSSVAVWLMAFPLLVPSTRGKTAIATFATALMDPLGLLISVLLGHQPAPLPTAAIAMFLPTAVACVIAIVGSRIVYRLTAEAGRAEELGSYRLGEWARCGGPSTGCSRATPPSSSCAAAPTCRGASSWRVSSARRRSRRGSARRTPCSSTTSGARTTVRSTT